jgi:hypothetical protein
MLALDQIYYAPNVILIKDHHNIYNKISLSNFVEFTYTNDRFSKEMITYKQQKYQPLEEVIRACGCQIALFLIITASTKGKTHLPSLFAIGACYNMKNGNKNNNH